MWWAHFIADAGEYCYSQYHVTDDSLILRRDFTRSHTEPRSPTVGRMPIFPLVFSTVSSGSLTQAGMPKPSLSLQLIIKSMIVLTEVCHAFFQCTMPEAKHTDLKQNTQFLLLMHTKRNKWSPRFAFILSSPYNLNVMVKLSVSLRTIQKQALKSHDSWCWWVNSLINPHIPDRFTGPFMEHPLNPSTPPVHDTFPT